MNGVVLSRANNQIFDFYSSLIEEVIAYCKSQGYENIDKIVFISSYDTDLNDGPKMRVKMKGDSNYLFYVLVLVLFFLRTFFSSFGLTRPPDMRSLNASSTLISSTVKSPSGTRI